VLAIAEEGGLLNAPDVYMDKLAVGPGYPAGIIDLAKSPTENVKAVAAAKGVAPEDIVVCVLDRPRHADLIAELRGIGCGVYLIGDGDVAGVIATTDENTNIDITWARAARPKACWPRPRCAAWAGSSRAAWCSATTTKRPAPRNGASPI
jgi:fructose-1,6-bisphosphatase II / sedoheptulose-1,7-bisphosphatase